MPTTITPDSLIPQDSDTAAVRYARKTLADAVERRTAARDLYEYAAAQVRDVKSRYSRAILNRGPAPRDLVYVELALETCSRRLARAEGAVFEYMRELQCELDPGARVHRSFIVTGPPYKVVRTSTQLIDSQGRIVRVPPPPSNLATLGVDPVVSYLFSHYGAPAPRE